MGQRHCPAGRRRADGPRVAERALTRHGYTVITADNGEEALEILTRREGSTSDQRRGHAGMDGPTMVREARKTRPDLKILFMSGYAEGAAAQVDRHRKRQLPAQAVFRDRTGRSARESAGVNAE